MDSELFLKVSQREERTNRIEAFLVFPVAALYFSVVSWGVRACLKSSNEDGNEGKNENLSRNKEFAGSIPNSV